MIWGGAGRGVNVQRLMWRPVQRFKNQCDPWMFSVVTRQMQGLVLDCIELVGVRYSWVSAYVPNSILQCLLKSKIVSVMIVRVERL